VARVSLVPTAGRRVLTNSSFKERPELTSPISCTRSMESISKEIERDGGVGQGPAHVVRDRFDADVGQLRAVLVRGAVDEHVESSP
jgi:hypothetical protein